MATQRRSAPLSACLAWARRLSFSEAFRVVCVCVLYLIVAHQITLLSRDFFRARITHLIDMPVTKILGRGLQSEHLSLADDNSNNNNDNDNNKNRRLYEQGIIEWEDDIMDERLDLGEDFGAILERAREAMREFKKKIKQIKDGTVGEALNFDRYLDIYLPFKKLAPPAVSICDKWRARVQAEAEKRNSSSSSSPLSSPPSSKLLLAIGIISYAPNWELREAARDTWLKMPSIGDCVDYKFVLAKTPNQTVEDRIEKERDEHGDILLLDYVEHYDLILKKSLATFKKGLEEQARFVMKCDDDTFVYIDQVVENILQKMSTVEADEEQKASADIDLTFIGKFDPYPPERQEPQRDPDSPYYLSFDVYPPEFFAPYAQGPAYILSRDLASRIMHRFTDHQLKYMLSLEDVSVGLWVEQIQEETGVEVNYQPDDRYNHFECKIDSITSHYRTPEKMRCMYERHGVIMRAIGKKEEGDGDDDANKKGTALARVQEVGIVAQARRPAIAGQAANSDQDPKSKDEDSMVNHWESRGLLEDGEGNEVAVVAVETKQDSDDSDDDDDADSAFMDDMLVTANNQDYNDNHDNDDIDISESDISESDISKSDISESDIMIFSSFEDPYYEEVDYEHIYRCCLDLEIEV